MLVIKLVLRVPQKDAGLAAARLTQQYHLVGRDRGPPHAPSPAGAAAHYSGKTLWAGQAIPTSKITRADRNEVSPVALKLSSRGFGKWVEWGGERISSLGGT